MAVARFVDVFDLVDSSVDWMTSEVCSMADEMCTGVTHGVPFGCAMDARIAVMRDGRFVACLPCTDGLNVDRDTTLCDRSKGVVFGVPGDRTNMENTSAIVDFGGGYGRVSADVDRDLHERDAEMTWMSTLDMSICCYDDLGCHTWSTGEDKWPKLTTLGGSEFAKSFVFEMTPYDNMEITVDLVGRWTTLHVTVTSCVHMVVDHTCLNSCGVPLESLTVDPSFRSEGDWFCVCSS